MKKILEVRKDTVFYIKLFPLKRNSAAYEKTKAIICRKSMKLLEDAYEKKPLPKPDCQTQAVDENIKLADKLGIPGLPFLILPDGRGFSGYKDAPTLSNLIGN